MAFDVNAALSSGYSPNEVADYLGQQKGFDAAAARQSGYTDDEIIAHLSGPVKTPSKSGLGTDIKRGFEQLVSSGQAAYEAVTKGDTEAALRAQARQSDIQSRLGEGASFERLKDVYNQQGILAAAKELGGQIPSAIAEQLPNIGTQVASGLAGAAAGSAILPGVGTVIGGLGGAFVPSVAQMYSGAIQRQAEVQQSEGKPVDISSTKALAAAIPGALLDTASTLIPLGGNIVSKILGPTIGKLVTAGGSKVAEEALLTTITKGTLKGIAAEVPTEVTQQILERAQAGLPLTTEDALREYGETAFAVSLLGPIGIIGRVSDKAKAGRDLAAAQQAAAAANEPQQVTIQTADSPEPVVMYVSPTGDVSDSLEKLQQAAQFKKYYEDQNAPAPAPVSQTTEAYAVPGDKEAIMAARMEEARKFSPAMQKINDIAAKKQQFLAKEQAALDEMKAKQSAFTNAPMEGGVIRPPSAQEIAAQEAKTASYANRVTVAAQENGKVNIYEGEMNPSGKTVNVIDPVTGAKKSFNLKQKNIVVDPTEKDIFAFEEQGLTIDLKNLEKEIKDAEKEVSGRATNFEEWIKKNPIKESEIQDVLPSAMEVRSGGKGTKIARGARKFFSKNGSAVDDLALRAVEDGVMTQEELDNPGNIGGVNAFLSKLEAAYNKETIETPENRDAIAQIATLYNQKEQLEQEIENQKALAAAPTEEEIGMAQAPEFVANEPATPVGPVTPGEYAQREPVTPSFRAEVPYEFSPQAKRDMAKIIPRLTQTLDRMGLRNIGLNLAQNLKANIDGKITKVNGTYLNRIITLCLDNRGIEATLHHEAIHALKEMGMFSQKEWATLSKIAKDKWIDQYNINARYPNASPEVKIEEAIASAFPDYMKQVGQPRGLLQRIKDFVQRVGNVFRGFGYNSPESVFAKTEAGKLTGEGKAAQVAERAAVPTNTESFKNWFEDSKVVNKDGKPLVMYHHAPNFEGNEFLPEKAQANDIGYHGEGFYFGSDQYLKHSAYGSLSTGNNLGAGFTEGSQVIPTYLSIKNPKYIQSYDQSLYGASKEQLKAQGYDGVIVLNGDEIYNAVAFNPNQIKSSIGNKGTFSKESNDIRNAIPTNTENFKNWFGDSQVVDENGKPLVVYRGQRRDAGAESTDLTIRATPSFTDNKYVASVYSYAKSKNQYTEGSNIAPVYISMQSPIDLREFGNEPKPLIDLLEAAGITGLDESPDVALNILKDLDDLQDRTGFQSTSYSGDYEYVNEAFNKLDNATEQNLDAETLGALAFDILEDLRVDAFALPDSPTVVKYVKEYNPRADGFIVRDAISYSAMELMGKENLKTLGNDSGYDAYRPFKQNQIKSAIGNKGTFSKESDDIRAETPSTIEGVIDDGIKRYANALVKNGAVMNDGYGGYTIMGPSSMGGRADAALTKIVDGIEKRLKDAGASTTRDERGNKEIDNIIYQKVIAQGRKLAIDQQTKIDLENKTNLRAEVPTREKLKAPMQGVDPAYAEKLRKAFTQEQATVQDKMKSLR